MFCKLIAKNKFEINLKLANSLRGEKMMQEAGGRGAVNANVDSAGCISV